MGFYETPVRRLHLVRAGGLFVLAVAFALVPILVRLDTMGLVACYGFTVGCAIAALVCIRRARRTRKGEVAYAFPAAAPPGEQLRMYRGLLWVSFVSFPLLSAAVAYELNRLESGQTGRATLWAPLVPIYERFGFWAAVLSPLLLAALCCAVLAWKIRALSRPARAQ
ncbi:MAG TPA: hypothetical protein VFY93_08685 [Planctomycetota bacterium]|nr:hypothetical protein [Planctomycetota bacterium]